MTYYLKNGNTFNPTDESNLDIHTTLPVGNYIIRINQGGQMYFEEADDFTFPSKRYGDNPRWTQRIVNTFLNRKNGTGVMLTGEKGSGKSLLARSVSEEAAKQGIPTIIINSAYCGDSFNMFVQAIEQPAILLFDEFEKVYDKHEQEAILTLLDGVFPSQKLFLFTCNDKWRVDVHMRNRPGRIFYVLDFKGLKKEFIEEYCEDNLNNKSHISTICKISMLFHQFNFDMLKALVEEMNRYDESPTEALAMLNVRPEFDNGEVNYDVVLLRDEVPMILHTAEWQGNPLTSTVGVYYKDPAAVAQAVANGEADKDDEEDEAKGVPWTRLNVTPNSLVTITHEAIVYEAQGFRLIMKRKKEEVKAQSWYDAF